MFGLKKKKTTEHFTLSGETGEILRMEHISKEYQMGEEKFLALDDVNLTVTAGEFLAILGPSGSGKSTLMNIIGCLDTPTTGTYYLSGRQIADQDEKTLAHIRNREVGFIFQSFYLLQKQTVLENVMLPLIYANMSDKQREARALEMLEKVGLSDKVDSFPNQLSGGQQQRVAIARAISTNPTILLADEPTGALDQRTGAQVIDEFKALNDEGKTIIMITHDANIAKHAKRIVRILDGKLYEGGELSDA